MKIVISGSFGDLNGIRYAMAYVQSLGNEVIFPTEEYFKNSEPYIAAHHDGKGEIDEMLELRADLMQLYFDKIRECDMLFVQNMKNGEEHIGSGTLMEIGYAYALKKPIRFMVNPTDTHIIDMMVLLDRKGL